MNLARKLYELQLIDSEIQGFRENLSQLNLKIGKNEALLMAKAELQSMKQHLVEIGQKRRDLDWKVDDLQKEISKLNDKLYGGKIANPKELMSLDQEKESFTTNLRQQEDELLDLMNEEEETQKKIKVQTEQIEKADAEWQEEQKTLIQKRDEVEGYLIENEKKRQALAGAVNDAQALGLYENILLKKGQAVVKVEQGRCRGCRITLAVNEWQRAKAGALIQCSSCGKLLYLE
ncbi:zinc ribbon domain-containing protein [Chloroflexota bacterium]